MGNKGETVAASLFLTHQGRGCKHITDTPSLFQNI